MSNKTTPEERKTMRVLILCGANVMCICVMALIHYSNSFGRDFILAFFGALSWSGVQAWYHFATIWEDKAYSQREVNKVREEARAKAEKHAHHSNNKHDDRK